MAAKPVRTCVVCRERSRPDDLVRMVLAPNGVAIVDFRGKLPGRGAWVHPGCLVQLERKPAGLKRSFKCDVPTGPWLQQYRMALERALCDGFSMAAASGALVGGRVVLEAALREGAAMEVVLASDAADRTVRALRAAAPEGMNFTVITLNAETLGAQVGKGSRAAVGVRPSRATKHLRRQLRRLRSLG